MMADVSSTQVHQSHPDIVAGTSLLHPHARTFPGGLQASGFLAAQGGELSGYFDEPSVTTRCTVILSGTCSMKAGGQKYHFQARDLILARTSSETFTFENSAEFSALEIHAPSMLLEQMHVEPFTGIQARPLGLQDLAMRIAKQLLGYLRTAPGSCSQISTPDVLRGYGMAMTILGYAFTSWGTEKTQLNKKNIARLETARQALLKHFDRAPTIPQLAAMCDLSPTRFKGNPPIFSGALNENSGSCF
ncbi:hypothetical protein [Acetobacter ascendens]|nr:hypothetical protein [Acetobacter ascendens]